MVQQVCLQGDLPNPQKFDTVAAIIPVYEEENMEYLITPFFLLHEELGHDTPMSHHI